MKKLIEDGKCLAILDDQSEVARNWRASMVEELVAQGYSPERAGQVVDGIVARARRQ